MPEHTGVGECREAHLESCISLTADDVRDLVGRAFASFTVIDLDADDCALLSRVYQAMAAVGEGFSA